MTWLYRLHRLPRAHWRNVAARIDLSIWLTALMAVVFWYTQILPFQFTH